MRRFLSATTSDRPLKQGSCENTNTSMKLQLNIHDHHVKAIYKRAIYKSLLLYKIVYKVGQISADGLLGLALRDGRVGLELLLPLLVELELAGELPLLPGEHFHPSTEPVSDGPAGNGSVGQT